MHRFHFCSSRSLGILGCTQSLMPLYNADAAARLTSHISVDFRACCELSQEAAEVAEILAEYGIQEHEYQPVVNALTKNPQAWLDFMMKFELGLEKPDPKRALYSAMTIAIGYILGGLVPLIPYTFIQNTTQAVKFSVLVTLIALLIFGFVKGYFTGNKLWAAGWQTAVSQIGPNFVWWVVAQSVFYHLYNQVSYMSLDQISPLTFSIGNTMKRISVIVSSILIFHTPLQPINALRAAIAILGTFIYSQEIIPGPVEMIPEKMVETELVKQEVVKLPSTVKVLCCIDKHLVDLII